MPCSFLVTHKCFGNPRTVWSTKDNAFSRGISFEHLHCQPCQTLPRTLYGGVGKCCMWSVLCQLWREISGMFILKRSNFFFLSPFHKRNNRVPPGVPSCETNALATCHLLVKLHYRWNAGKMFEPDVQLECVYILHRASLEMIRTSVTQRKLNTVPDSWNLIFKILMIWVSSLNFRLILSSQLASHGNEFKGRSCKSVPFYSRKHPWKWSKNKQYFMELYFIGDGLHQISVHTQSFI